MSPLLSEDSASLCEEIAEETRAELGLGAKESVEPSQLARLLAIEVVALEEFADRCPAEVEQLRKDDTTALSAVTFFCGSECKVIVNPDHPHHPEEESVGHELAHVLLEHEPKQLFDDCGVRIWHDCDEAQADYLASALVVSSAELGRMLAVLEGDVVTLAAHYGADLAIIAERVGRLAPTSTQAPPLEGPMLGDAEPSAMPALGRLRSTRPPSSEDGGSPTPAASPAA